ncbi:MAG: hypothetical protein ACLPWF_26715 [Bryobacteraceae bacterium]
MWRRDWFKNQNRPSVPATRPLSILSVGICLDDRFVLEQLGDRHGWQLYFTISPEEAFRTAARTDFDLILCDRNQPRYPWREVMDRLVESSPRSCILLVSPASHDYLWWDVLHHHGFDVLIRPLREEMVLRMVEAAARFLSRAESCASN